MNETAQTPHRSSFLVHRFLASLWFGGAAFLLFVAAPAAFRAAPSSSVAAEVVGAMLARWHYVALVVPLILFLLALRRQRTTVALLCFAAIVLAAIEVGVDLRIRMIRASLVVPVTSLERSDPVRRRFGLLHGISSFLLLAQVVAAGVVVAKNDE